VTVQNRLEAEKSLSGLTVHAAALVTLLANNRKYKSLLFEKIER